MWQKNCNLVHVIRNFLDEPIVCDMQNKLSRTSWQHINWEMYYFDEVIVFKSHFCNFTYKCAKLVFFLISHSLIFMDCTLCSVKVYYSTCKTSIKMSALWYKSINIMMFEYLQNFINKFVRAKLIFSGIYFIFPTLIPIARFIQVCIYHWKK